MKKENQKIFIVAAGLLIAFLLWTLGVCYIDLKPIGPDGSIVGLAALNGCIHSLTGTDFTLYTITDWLGLVPIAFAFGFALLGLFQWIGRRNILKVDWSILTLGGFYILVISAYIFFELVVINRRPVLIAGYLEASYPSSTTMLVTCVMPTAIMQFTKRIKNNILKCIVVFAIILFIAFMVIGRFLSGVHWFSDIIGGALLSGGLVTLYYAVNNLK